MLLHLHLQQGQGEAQIFTDLSKLVFRMETEKLARGLASEDGGSMGGRNKGWRRGAQ